MATPNDLVRVRPEALAPQPSSALDVPSAARAARSALSPVVWIQDCDALASAVIYALAPDRMAVYDKRANSGSRSLTFPHPGAGQVRQVHGSSSTWALRVRAPRRPANCAGHRLALFALAGPDRPRQLSVYSAACAAGDRRVTCALRLGESRVRRFPQLGRTMGAGTLTFKSGRQEPGHELSQRRMAGSPNSATPLFDTTPVVEGARCQARRSG